jgi:hypothetical protein
VRLFGKVDGTRDRLDRPFTFRGLPFDIQWRPPVVEEPPTGALARAIFTSAPRLGLTVYEYPGGPLVGDWTRAQGVVIETGEHGFAAITGFLPASALEAFQIYAAERMFHLVCSDGLLTAYEGRVEDLAIQARGVGFTGLGYWRAMSDVPYTGLFADAGFANWNVLPPESISTALPDKFSADNNNRLYLAPNNGETFDSSTAWGVFGYAAPAGSEQQMVEISFHYKMKGNSPWRIRLDRRDADWNLLSTEWTLDGAGTIQEGDVTETFAGCDRLTFSIFYNSSNTAYTGETGDVYMRITVPKIRAVSGTITAKTIADALVEFVSDINETQLSGSTAGIGDPGLALESEVFQDVFPADILTGLGALGDTQTPPRRWIAAVWEKRLLRFAPEGDGSRTWYVDVVDFQLERSMDGVANEVYSSFNGSFGAAARTDIVTDGAAVRRQGVTRRTVVQVDSSSQAVAENFRDLTLAERSRPKPRARIITRGVMDSAGVAHPLYAVRAGDTLVLRNLPANTFGGIDDVRSFRLSATRYDCDRDELTPTPADSLMALDIIVARRERSL